MLKHWIMLLLRAIFLNKPPVVTTTTESPETLDPVSTPTLVSGEDYAYIHLNNLIDKLNEFNGAMNNDSFSDALFKEFSTRFKNHHSIIQTMEEITQILNTQLNDIEGDYYIEKNAMTLQTYVTKTRSYAVFLQSESKTYTMNSALESVKKYVTELHVLYVRAINHPKLPDYKKDYFSRRLHPFVFELSEYTSNLIDHGTIK